MKKTLIFLIVASFAAIAVQEVQAQASTKRPSSAPVEKESSWFFILEKEKQWTLTIQDNSDLLGNSAFTNSGFEGLPGNSGGNTANSTGNITNSIPVTGLVGGIGSGSATGTGSSVGDVVDPANSGDTNSNSLVFEGNTEDLPFTDPPGKPVEPTPVKPSAPSS